MWSSGGDDAHNDDAENADNSALLILSTEGDKPQPPDLLSQDEQWLSNKKTQKCSVFPFVYMFIVVSFYHIITVLLFYA